MNNKINTHLISRALGHDSPQASPGLESGCLKEGNGADSSNENLHNRLLFRREGGISDRDAHTTGLGGGSGRVLEIK